MASERFFTKVTNNVLEATEQLATQFEESLSLIFGGEAAKDTAAASGGAAADRTTNTFEFDGDQDDLEESLLNNPLQGIADGVLGGIMDGQMGPATPMENFHAFRSAISWSEPFIISLVAFQVVMLVLSVYVSRRDRGLAPRLTIMGIIAVTVKSSEYINRLAAQNWQSFCTQNYFDKGGVFMSVMVCAPLLLDSLVMLLLFLREATQLLIQVKTIQLKKQGRNSGCANKENDNKENGGETTKERRSKKDQ